MHNGGIYFFVMIGIAFYYIKGAPSFADGVLGVLKALVWPAVVAYKLFKHMRW